MAAVVPVAQPDAQPARAFPGRSATRSPTQYPGGIGHFIRDAFEAVLLELPFKDNYFWRVYLQGHYTPDCCPEYLKKDNFDRLKTLLPRLHIHTSTMTDFLRQAEPGLSRFVLLDHMDWMAFNHPQGLVDEWNAILDTARPNARVIFRSAGLEVDYLDHLQVQLSRPADRVGPAAALPSGPEHQAAQDRSGAHLRLLRDCRLA